MVNKITTPPTHKELVDKTNEIIDALGMSAGANTDLSNLSLAGQAIIDGKADIDLSAITSTGKQTSVVWGTPDLTVAPVSIPANTPYQLPYNALVCHSAYSNSWQNYVFCQMSWTNFLIV